MVLKVMDGKIAEIAPSDRLRVTGCLPPFFPALEDSIGISDLVDGNKQRQTRETGFVFDELQVCHGVNVFRIGS